MGSTRVNMPAPPPAPTPVDPAQSSLDYIRAMSDPALQQRLLEAEQMYRPQYTALNLQELEQYTQGSTGILGQAAQQTGAIDRQLLSQQRAQDIADVEALGQRATEAFRNANPQLQAALQRAESMAGPTGGQFGEFEQGALAMNQRAQGTPELGATGGILQGRAQEFAQSRGQLNPEEIRALTQQIREGYAARGTEMGSGAISAEALGRLSNERQRMQEDLAMASALNQGTLQEQTSNRAYQQQALGNLGLLGQYRQGAGAADRAYGLQLAGLQQGVASDPFQAILGRPSQAIGYGMQQQGFGAGLMGQFQGPQLFDPNAGINLALQNASNQANYSSNIYGAQAGVAGAQAGARGAAAGGLASGLGALAGGFLLGPVGAALGSRIGGCWVARAAWGNDNPKWLEFRKWLFERSPYWFCSAYLENGESLANVIKQFAVLRFAVRVLLSGILQMEQKRNVPFAGLLQAVFCGFVYCLLVLQKLPSGNFLGNSRHRYQSDLRICHSDVHPYPQEMPQMSSSVRKHECPVLHNLRIRAYRGICNAASLISRLSKSVLNITRGDNCVASCALGEQNAQAVRMSTQKP